MASSLSKYHTLTSFLPLKSLDNAKLSSSLIPSPINLSSNNTCAHLFNNNNKTTPLLSSNPIFVTVIAMAPPPKGGKAKKVVGLIKLALKARKATLTPPVGPALGSNGVNIMAFCKDYNARTADKDKKAVHLLFELNDECDTNTTIENNKITNQFTTSCKRTITSHPVCQRQVDCIQFDCRFIW